MAKLTDISRRQLVLLALANAGVAGAGNALANGQGRGGQGGKGQGRGTGPLNPRDPSAVALGYTTDHTRVDLARWPKKGREQSGAPQRCGTCAMRSDDGGCRLFAGRQVTDNGWCNAWTAR